MIYLEKNVNLTLDFSVSGKCDFYTDLFKTMEWLQSNELSTVSYRLLLITVSEQFTMEVNTVKVMAKIISYVTIYGMPKNHDHIIVNHC